MNIIADVEEAKDSMIGGIMPQSKLIRLDYTTKITDIVFYSALKELWQHNDELIKYPFPVVAESIPVDSSVFDEIHLEMVNGWEIANPRQVVKFRYLNEDAIFIPNTKRDTTIYG